MLQVLPEASNVPLGVQQYEEQREGVTNQRHDG